MAAHILPVLESLCAEGELTINQLAKSLKKSYGYTNAHVHELAAQGILTKREVGSALLCSLNYTTEETIGLLVLSSIRKKQSYLKSLTEKERAAVLELISGVPPSALTIYLDKRRLTVITDAQARPASGVRIMRTADFSKELRSIDLKDIIVMQNHEAFWNAIAQHKAP